MKPEFTKHTVETTADWSGWVCPDPESYLMKCCDCGLVHEAQFGVVRYKSETEREDCDKVDDPNLQAVFRMRRHEAWEPEDTAHRAGGLPMEQEPVAWMHTQLDGVVIPHRPADLNRHPERWQALHKIPPTCQTCEALARTVMLDQTSHDISPPQQEPAAYVYKATTQQGEVAYFGVKSTARAWAKSGTVEFLPLKTLELVQKPAEILQAIPTVKVEV